MTTPATGVLLGGRYRLSERIASGGMGTVWAAEDETLHRRIAVKVLNDALGADERFTERFRDYLRRRHNEMAGIAGAIPLDSGDSGIRASEDGFLDIAVRLACPVELRSRNTSFQLNHRHEKRVKIVNTCEEK